MKKIFAVLLLAALFCVPSYAAMPDKTYSVMASSYVLRAKGDGHRFEGARMTRSDFITDTDALAHYIKSLSSIPETYREPQGQGRIKVIGK